MNPQICKSQWIETRIKDTFPLEISTNEYLCFNHRNITFLYMECDNENDDLMSRLKLLTLLLLKGF